MGGGTGNYFTTAGGTSFLSRGPDTKRRTEIAGKEETMVDEINQLETDPSTGLPVLSRLQEDADLAKKEKEEAISGLGMKAGTAKDKIFADLFKSGVTKHGKFVGLEKDLSESFGTDVKKVMTDFGESSGDVEDRAMEDLEGIRSSIVDTKNLYESTDTLETQFPQEKYETTLSGGRKETNPLKVKDEMYEYDYITGLKDKLNG